MADIHVTLVIEMEKYPELYNYKLADYSRKDITDRAWAAVSNKTKIPVNECKEKWRNIRSNFIRSLSGSKPKKPYYLKDHLFFVLPFVKPVIDSPSPGNIPTPPTAEESDSSIANTETETVQAEEFEDQRTADNNENKPNVNQPEDTSTQEERAANSQTGGKRRRQNNNLDGAMLTYLKRKNKQQGGGPKQNDNNQSKMNHFFMSILNDFDDMADQQIRRFKINTLQLIDDIKQSGTPYSRETLRSTSSSSHNWSSAYSPISAISTPTPPQPSPSPVHVPYNFVNTDFSYDDM